MTKFICVGGKAGNGKDHCVSILTRYLEKQGKKLYQTAFADHLKQQCCNVTGVALHMWHMDKTVKNKDNSALRVINCRDAFFKAWCLDNKHSLDVPRSMRWWMQYYSDYKKEKHGSDYYIAYAVDNIYNALETSKPDYVVLTDARYPAEVWNFMNLPTILNGDYKADRFASVYVHNPDNVVGTIPENVAVHQHNSEHSLRSHESEQLGQEAFQHVILNTYSTRDEAILEQWKEILNVK